GGKPLAVARDHGVVGRKARDQRMGQIARTVVVGEAEERPAALAEALYQASLREEPQVSGNSRLRLAQDFGQVRDGQLGLGEEREDTQARALPGRLEGGVEGVEGQVGRWSHRGTFPNGPGRGRKTAEPATSASPFK